MIRSLANLAQLRFSRTIGSCDRGVALIEFAIVAPVLILLYIGGWQLSDAIACNRKVTITTRATADLVSQYAILSATQVDSILGASAQIMAPYPNTNAMIRVSEISTDQYGNTKVVWSRASNGKPLTPNSTFNIPATIKLNGTSLIFSEVIYNYTPVANFGFVRQMNLSEHIYMVPRVSNDIACDACNGS